MSNGGHISCSYCAFNFERRAECEIYGIETGPFILCRTFRLDRSQTLLEAIRQYRILKELLPGTVYAIDNDAFAAGRPRPVYNLQTWQPGSGVPGPADREVSAVLASLIPDPHQRELCLQILVSAIRAADTANPESWGLSLYPDRLRLVVGALAACTIHGGAVWVPLDPECVDPTAERALEEVEGWQWSPEVQYVTIPILSGYYRPDDAHFERTVVVIGPANASFITKAAHRWRELLPRSKAKHSPAVVRYLRSALQEHVPDPGWA